MNVSLRVAHLSVAIILATQGISPRSLAAQAAVPSTRSATLAQAAAVTAADRPREHRQFTTWLRTNASSLPPERAQGVREHLYFLIGSAAQAQFRATGQLFPSRDTLGLAELFDHGTRLNLHGAGLVARALNSAAAPDHFAPPVLPSEPMSLSFSAPEYTLRSARGWSVRFPYYYMIGMLQVVVPRNGVETESVVLSTLFANHRGAPGQSQATLLLLAAAPTDTSAFFDFWLRTLQLGAADRSGETLIPGGTTYRGFDTTASMNKELVTLTRGRLAFVLVYTGLSGTFEANRADAWSVLESLSVESSMR